MESSLDIVVRSTEIDEVGHVNNAKYLEYLEWGREDWYALTGFAAERLAEQNIATVVVNININYRREAKKGERLTIVTRPVRKGHTSFVVRQKIYNREGDCVVDADVTIVMFDLYERQSTPIPESLTHVFSEKK